MLNSQSNPMSLLCGWRDCYQLFADYLSLKQHIEIHMNSNPKACQWKQCSYEHPTADVSPRVFMRHVLWHAHLEVLTVEGVNSLAIRGLNICRSKFKCDHDLQVPPHFPLPLQCIASGCDFTTDSIREFLNHCLSHASEHTDETTLPDVPFYACTSCRRTFIMEYDFLRHVHSALVNYFPAPSYLPAAHLCHWLDCNLQFTTMAGLHEHVQTSHFTCPSNFYCMWRGCITPSHQSLTYLQWLRHALLHVHFEARRVYTYKRLAIKDGSTLRCSNNGDYKPSCFARKSTIYLWHPLILGDGFVCSWNLCGFVSDSAELFIEHVSTHANVGECADLTCKWQLTSEDKNGQGNMKLCGRILSRPTHMRTHLFRHTGLLKFFCSSCDTGFAELSTFKEHLEAGTISNKAHSTDNSTASASTASTSVPSSDERKCPGCLRTFNTNHYYKAHLRQCLLLRQGRPCTSKTASASVTSQQSTQAHSRTHVSNSLIRKSMDLVSSCLASHDVECSVIGCFRRFKNMGYYQRHYIQCHDPSSNGPTFACHLCTGQVFTRRALLSSHLRLVHRLQPMGSRFSFVYDPREGSYRLSGTPPPIHWQSGRTILKSKPAPVPSSEADV